MLEARRILITLGAAGLIGIGGPVLDVAVKCERSRALRLAVCPTSDADSLGTCPATSEACVWGKALLPVSIAVGLVVLGGPAGLLAFWWTGRRSRPRPVARFRGR